MYPPVNFDFHCHSQMDLSVQLQMHIYRRSEEQFAKWEAHKDELQTPDHVKKWQAHIRRCVFEGLGNLPAERTPLNAKIVGEVKADGYKIEKLIYESQPEVYVTANVYLPSKIKGKTAAVLFVCGHADEAKAYPNYQMVCQRLVRNGFVVLAMDPPGQGERRSYLDAKGNQLVRWGVPEHDYAGLQCWWNGQSPARYFIWDAMRAIDYLETRPEVDSKRIGVTGNSGGGTQSSWLMLTEPRLAAAAPGTYVMRRLEYLWTGQAQDCEQIIPGGTAAGIDHEDFMIAMAPKPVIVLATDYDFFNMEGTVASVERARRIYRIFGKEENLALATDRFVHQYTANLAKASTTFFAKHLLGKAASEIDHKEPEPMPQEKLWCTKSGQIMLEEPKTKRIFDRNLEVYEKGQRKLNAETAAKWLSHSVNTHRKPMPPYTRWPWDNTYQDIRVVQGFWFTEPMMCNAGYFIRPADKEYDDVTIVVSNRGTLDMEARREWIYDNVREGHALLFMDVRGMGNLLPRAVSPCAIEENYGTMFKFVYDAVCLEDDLASMRIYDVLKAVEMVKTDALIALGERPVKIFGSGIGGFYAYLAAAIQPDIKACEIEDTLFSLDSLMRSRYYEDNRQNQIVIFGMAAQFDMPDLKPLFKGRKLTVTRPRDAQGEIIEK